MNCDICGQQHHPQRLPFLCAVDARNQLYELRLANATALIENEQLERRIDALLSSNPTSSNTEPPSSKRVCIDNWKSEQQRALDKTGDIIAQAERLKREVEAARKDIELRKEAISRRRSDLASVSNGVAARRARQLAEVERSISMARFSWNRSYDGMAATRAFLCMEAARLYGLRRVKKGSSVRYEIGGVEIVDPYSMNGASPEAISTSLAHMTHILMLASHYLAIRLPAEVTLPHRDYPRPTIFALASSYSHGDVPFPGTSSLHSQVPPPESRDRDNHQRTPRARPLFVDKPVAVLAKEDAVTHNMFLEGVALLAYDIAWACCSQGVPIGEKSSFDDVFSMGRNLYNLLIGNQLHSNPAGRIFSASSSPAPNSNDGELGEIGKAANLMGRYSHGTAHTFLGDDVVHSFKLPNPSRLTDRLKGRLANEAGMPDWEVLEDDAWAADDHMEDGVLVKGRKRGETERRLYGVESMATVRAAMDETIGDGIDLQPRIGSERVGEKTRSSGTSGWTKLKTR